VHNLQARHVQWPSALKAVSDAQFGVADACSGHIFPSTAQSIGLKKCQ
jgi:hypothetical protein